MEPTNLSLSYAALSDVGRVRRDNQDSGFAGPHLLAVADGVGGAARGDIASATTVHILRRLDAPPSGDMQEALAGAVHRAHDRLGELVEADPSLEGTSTTCTAALFDGGRIALAHVGDSRGYLLRDGELTRLTSDHTFVQSLIDEGRISEDEARTHPHRNLILRALDAVHEPDPDLSVIEMAAGDRLLLCSDGCSGALDDGRLADILSTGSVDYAVVELVRAALEAGSTDNVTCVVADVVESREPAPAAGPMLVGAAAEQPRRAGAASRSFFRGHRAGDTGELAPVPGADVDPEELRYAPRAPRRFVWFRRVVVAVLALAVLAAAAVLGYNWTQEQYYVAADGNRVAIFRGVQANVPGLTMHRVATRTTLPLTALAPYRAEQVRSGIGAESMADAHEIVARLTGFARVCPEPGPGTAPSPSSPSGSPASSPGAGSSPRAGKSGTAHPERHHGGASRSPSPSPTTPSTTPSPTPTLAPPDCIEDDSP